MIAPSQSRAQRPDASSCPDRILADEAGATLLEVALTMPIFFFLVFGLINFALVMFGFCNVTYASRSAVRYACMHSGTSNPDTTVAASTTTAATASAVNAVASNFIYPYPANTTTTAIAYAQVYGGSGSGAGLNQVGNSVTVTLTITYTLILPFLTYHGPALTSASSGIIIR